MQAKEVNLMNKNDELQELPECDVKILEFVQSCGKADIETISKKLPRVEAVPLRVKRLAKRQYSSPDGSFVKRHPIPDTSYLIDFGENPVMYQLSELGKIAVQDNKRRRRQDRLRLWTNGALLPLLVTVIANLIANAPQWLLPLLQKWAETSHP